MHAYYTHTGRLEQARSLLESARRDGYTFDSDLSQAEWWLGQHEQPKPAAMTSR